MKSDVTFKLKKKKKITSNVCLAKGLKLGAELDLSKKNCFRGVQNA